MSSGALAACLMALGVVAAAPASAAVGPSFRTAHSSATAASKTMRHDLYKLRLCESGDHYRENTGNGYFGAYQFAPRTWGALGFKGRPDRAKAAVQNHAARKLHKAAGWSAWPSCSASEHLR